MMAEASSAAKEETDEEKKDKGESQECAVCLQPFVHPAQLPCGHIFCFLCVKGIANQSKRCAMCRQEIPRDFIEQPNLLNVTNVSAVEATTGFDGAYQWFYEGRNGWWQYDERTSKELETCYKSGDRTCELLIAGFLYIADLDAMLQLRRNDPSRRRRIKRDLATIQKKGVAGIRAEGGGGSGGVGDQQQIYAEESVREAAVPALLSAVAADAPVTPVTPYNTPQTPASGRQSPARPTQPSLELEATMQRIRSLRLQTASDSDDSDSQTNNQHAWNKRFNAL